MFKRLFSRSRMTRECPVRFYEGPQGLTKGSTHQKLLLSLILLSLGSDLVADRCSAHHGLKQCADRTTEVSDGSAGDCYNIWNAKRYLGPDNHYGSAESFICAGGGGPFGLEPPFYCLTTAPDPVNGGIKEDGQYLCNDMYLISYGQ